MMGLRPNLQVISESREEESDRSIWKLVLWGALSVAAAYFFVMSFERWLLSFNSVYLLSLIVTALIFWTLAALQVFFVKGLGKLALITFLECAAPLLAFTGRLYPTPSLVLLGGTAAAFILAFLAARRGRSFAQNSVTLRFFDIVKVFLPRFVAAWLVLLSVLFYASYFTWGYFTPALRTALLNETVTAATPVVKIWLPSFAPTVTVHDFLQGVARSQLETLQYTPAGVSDKNLTVSFSQLPETQQSAILSNATDGLMQTFEARFGRIDPNETMLQFTDALVLSSVSGLMAQIGILAGIAAAALVFFILKGIVALFYWLIAFTAFVVYKALIAFGFARTSVESRNREFVLLS